MCSSLSLLPPTTPTTYGSQTAPYFHCCAFFTKLLLPVLDFKYIGLFYLQNITPFICPFIHYPTICAVRMIVFYEYLLSLTFVVFHCLPCCGQIVSLTDRETVQPLRNSTHLLYIQTLCVNLY